MSFRVLGRPGARLVAALFAALFLTVMGSGHANAAVCRVTPTGNSTNDGSAWSAPMDLQAALGDVTCNEIWVKAGVYTPVIPLDPGNVTDAERLVSFAITRTLQIYGGFAGTESSRDARDLAANGTILSGDIDGNDANTDANFIDEISADIIGSNSHHVILMNGAASGAPLTASTVLDGFIITAGNSDAGGTGDGGGLYCHGGIVECSPSVSNSTFVGNKAQRNGGAMMNDGFGGVSSPTLSNVTFSGNTASAGGAMYNEGYVGASSPTLNNVTFSGNHADFGGALSNRDQGGASSPILHNVTFSGNAAGYGGAIYNSGRSSASNPIFSNVILWNNGLPAIYNVAMLSVPTVDHSIVEGCVVAGSLQPWCGNDGGNNSGGDPLLGVLGSHGGSTATILPDALGTAVDSGTCSDAPGVDQRGVARPQGSTCDIGAVEVEYTDVLFANGFD